MSEAEDLLDELDFLWKRQYGTRVPPALRTITTYNKLSFLEKDHETLGDCLKRWIERYSGEPWNWWPLNSPREKLVSQNVRLKWKCACGVDRWFDVTRELGTKYMAAREGYSTRKLRRKYSHSMGTSAEEKTEAIFLGNSVWYALEGVDTESGPQS